MVQKSSKKITAPARATRARKTVDRDYSEDVVSDEYDAPSYRAPAASPLASNNLLVVLLIVLAFFCGFLFFKVQNLETASKNAPNQPSTAQQQQPQPTVSLSSIKDLFKDGFVHFGDANKKILVVEISDPSCPFCHFAAGKNPEFSKTSTQFQYVTDGGSYTPPVPELRKLVDQGKASFVWIYSNGHGNGEIGAKALYCAQEKGKFWDAHDVLMSNVGYVLMNEKMKNDKANIPLMVDALSGVVDPTFMKSCLESDKYADTLKRDQTVSQKLGFQGTPDFFINTTNFGGAVDYSAMDAVIKPLL